MTSAALGCLVVGAVAAFFVAIACYLLVITIAQGIAA